MLMVFWVKVPCSTWRNNPEDHHLYSHLRDSIKSYIIMCACPHSGPCWQWCNVFQSGGAPHSPEAHGRGVAPAAGVEGGLAWVAPRGVEARMGAGVGKRACSWTEVGLVNTAPVPCLLLAVTNLEANGTAFMAERKNDQFTLDWKCWCWCSLWSPW
jgi:hypothetical protein